MCRIVGLIDLNKNYKGNELEQIIINMRDSLSHGGPDDAGIFIDGDRGVAIGHRRLSILDLSSTGHQPMSNEKEDLWITYNGEIYNFQEIREELKLKGYSFRSNTDTEVVMKAYEEWGEDAFNKLNGMFAFCIYDKKMGFIYLVRDHAGMKPLYYSILNDILIFASEVKAFKTLNKKLQENPDWRIFFLIFGHIPEPYTTLRDVYMLPKGSFIKVNLRTKASVVKEYTSIKFSEDIKDINDAIGGVKELFEKAVKRHLISDAPIGVFLSGGIDSSLISLVASQFNGDNLRTLSVVFNEKVYSEEEYQSMILKKIKSKHRTYLLTEKDFISSLDDIFSAMDQPTTDGVNTYFISKYAKEAGLKTVLSGLGGDELFGGYPSFNRIKKLWFYKHDNVSNSIYKLFEYIPHNKLKRLSFLSLPSPLSYYLLFRSIFTIREAAHLLDITEKEVLTALSQLPNFSSSEPLNPSSSYHASCMKYPESSGKNLVSALETNLYMQNQLLKDADFMSMWHSVETRVPFLDRDLMKYIFSIDEDIKFNGNVPKGLLLKAYKDILPSEIAYRSKMGFTFPFQEWMRNNLDLLVGSIPYKNKLPIKRVINNFGNGRLHWSRLWGLVVQNHIFIS